jgi:hypothetical protein
MLQIPQEGCNASTSEQPCPNGSGRIATGLMGGFQGFLHPEACCVLDHFGLQSFGFSLSCPSYAA